MVEPARGGPRVGHFRKAGGYSAQDPPPLPWVFPGVVGCMIWQIFSKSKAHTFALSPFVCFFVAFFWCRSHTLPAALSAICAFTLIIAFTGTLAQMRLV